MGRTLYLDCTNGISGDMTVAALLDLGASEEKLRAALASLPVEGYRVEVSRVAKAGLDACDFDVVLDAAHDGHDHDMAYLHGHDGEHDHAHAHHHEHDHGHDHCHDHGHDEGHGRHHHHDHGHVHAHSHDHHGHHHEHRSPADIDAIIEAGALTSGAKRLAHRMVSVLATAEAKAHGVELAEVHFHEVGAVDSVVDIVSVAVLLDDLGIDRVIVPELVDGHGTIRCQHGVIPVPVPATLNIVAAHGLPLSICEVEGELVTPTGAAIVAACGAEHELPQRFVVERVGLGAGKRAYSRPSLLRAMIIADASPVPQDRVVKLECDIDDATGEQLAYAAERLMEEGAREAHWVPVFGKKGRPAYQLQVIALPEDVARLEKLIFAETPTIGIRRTPMARTVLERREDTVSTAYGDVRIKRSVLPCGSERAKPELDDCARLARKAGVPLTAVATAARHAARHAASPLTGDKIRGERE